MRDRKLKQICRNIILTAMAISALVYMGYSNTQSFSSLASQELGGLEALTEGGEETLGGEVIPEGDGQASGGESQGDSATPEGDGTAGYGSQPGVISEDGEGPLRHSVTPPLSGEDEEEGEPVTASEDGEEGEPVTASEDGVEGEPVASNSNAVLLTWDVVTIEGGVTSESEYFASLQEALNELSSGSNFVITLQEDLTISEPLVIGSSAVLDLNGHSLSIDNANGIEILPYVTLTLQDNGINDDSGIDASCYAFSGQGILTMDSGLVVNRNGGLIKGLGGVVVNDGFLLSSAAVFENVVAIVINDGFLAPDLGGQSGASLCGEGCDSPTLPSGMVLTRVTAEIGNRGQISGYILDTASFVVTIGEEEAYDFESFEDAFEGAKEKSLAAGGKLATITCSADTMTIAAEDVFVLAESDLAAPSVSINGIDFIRKSGYEGTIFDVGAGRLFLKNVNVNGSLSNTGFAYTTASMIEVEDDASLILRGTAAKPTVITGNCAYYSADGNNASGAVFLEYGSTLDLAGNVSVTGNTKFYVREDGQESTSEALNIYVMDGADVVVSADLTGPERGIGFTYAKPIVNKITTAAVLSETHYIDLIESLGMDFDIGAVLKQFVVDNNSLYYLQLDDREAYWDNDERLLPEAGKMRFEWLLVGAGIFGFFLLCFKKFRESMKLTNYVTIFSVVSILIGGFVAIYNIQLDMDAYYVSTRTMKEMMATEGGSSDVDNVIFDTSVDDVLGGEDEASLKEAAESAPKLNLPKDGREYIGIVEVPDCNIKLPVLATYSDADMKTVPCIYAGAIATSDLVIVGHNYDSQFASLNNLTGNAKVKLTLMDGTQLSYESFTTDYLKPNQIEEMIQGDWDLTLFTCNYAGDKRVAVRCRLVD